MIAVYERNSVAAPRASIEARNISRSFQDHVVLREVSLAVAEREVHALLGPNGVGKTTLLRIIAGIIHPTAGSARVVGLDSRTNQRALRKAIGLVPSGDRSFYLRISGLENLVFFGRLYGYRRRKAVARARDVLAKVDLQDAADVPVGVYSHGMQKRLSIARALLNDPRVLLFDEATHDLDPRAAREVRDLVLTLARAGSSVLWATQRVDEISAFADRVTLLSEGRVAFSGTVGEFIGHAAPRRWLVGLRNGHAAATTALGAIQQAVGDNAVVAAADFENHYILALRDGVVLGDALSALSAASIQILTCREERSEIEQAFVALTTGEKR